jgi:hypothetical protein
MIKNGIEGAVNFIRKRQFDSWTIKSGKGQNDYVFKSNDDLDIESNLRMMEDQLDDLTDGKYYILGGNGRSSSGLQSECFVISDEHRSASPVSIGIPEGYISQSEMEARLEKFKEDWFKEQELKALKERVKELEAELKENESPVNKFLKNLEPVAAPLIGSLVGKLTGQSVPVGVQGLDNPNNNVEQPTEEVMEQLTEEEEKILKLCDEWRAVDPDFYSLMKKIAELAISGLPIMGMPYAQVKQMIINL